MKIELGELLKKYRNDQALTQQQMAARIGINRCLYTQIENGKKNISNTTIQKIAYVLKMNPSSIVDLLKGE